MELEETVRQPWEAERDMQQLYGTGRASDKHVASPGELEGQWETFSNYQWQW